MPELETEERENWLSLLLAVLAEANTSLADDLITQIERANAKWLCDCHTWPSPEECHAYIVAMEQRDKEQTAEGERLWEFVKDARAHAYEAAFRLAELEERLGETYDATICVRRTKGQADALLAAKQEGAEA